MNHTKTKQNAHSLYMKSINEIKTRPVYDSLNSAIRLSRFCKKQQ